MIKLISIKSSNSHEREKINFCGQNRKNLVDRIYLYRKIKLSNLQLWRLALDGSIIS